MRDKIRKRPQGLRKGDIRSEKKGGALVWVSEGQRLRVPVSLEILIALGCII